MLSSTRILAPGICALTSLGVGNSSHAAAAEDSDSHVSAMRYVSIDGQSDNADSSQYSATGSFTLGKYIWLQGTLGKLLDDTTNGLGDLKIYGVGTGVKGEHLQLTVNIDHYKNDDSYRQRDLLASLDWRNAKILVGLDASHRNTDNTYNYSITDTFPNLGVTTLATHATESLSGNGFGAHASFNLTDRLTLSLGGMGYHYNQTLNVNATLTSSQPQPIVQLITQLLQRRINLNIQNAIAQRSSSVVTRSVVPLDNSYNLGLSYYFDAASLSAQYVRDKVLDTDNTDQTFSLGASISLGDHWIVAPQAGYSSNDRGPDVTFGGLSIAYNW